MEQHEWEFVFQFVGALGSIATFGAFLFLWKKDTAKQEQLDRLTAISKTWASLFDLENRKHEAELLKNRLAIFPEFRVQNHNYSAKDHTITLWNVGHAASIEQISVMPINAAFIQNLDYPLIMDKDERLALKFSMSGSTHFDDTTIEIHYSDKAHNHYRICLNRAKLSQPIHI